MNNILSEKEYQTSIMEYLRDKNGYVIRKNRDFDRYYACDHKMLMDFLYATQPADMEALNKI